MNQPVYLLSNGDYRDSAGRVCWNKQVETLSAVEAAFAKLNVKTKVVTQFDPKRKHGFITTQAEGAAILAEIPADAPVAVVLSCWAYAHHVCGPLQTHKGPIILIGNFDGTWPGLVALLNHSGSLERLCVVHSKLWSESFANDTDFMTKLATWCKNGKVVHNDAHVVDASKLRLSDYALQFGEDLAGNVMLLKRIMGQLDPGCMGMLNAVINPAKLGAIGMPIEYMSQSDLLAEMELVDKDEAKRHLAWLLRKGTLFNFGNDEATELTRQQALSQMRMYSAAARLYRRFGLAAIGIPYQIGLVRCCPASDLVEGMLNNADRPGVVDPETRRVIAKGKAIPHFNEGDMGSGVPQVLMHDIYERKGMPTETTLHDVRWGREYNGKFVWVLLISGAAPPAHFGGWKHTKVYRQPPMYFPLGGGTCSGVSKPGVITWARFYESFGEIGMDCGTGKVVAVDKDDLKDRLVKTTPVWPIANVHIPGYGRDQLMATHKSNHITIGYGDILQELIATCLHLGIPTRVAGDVAHQLA